MDKSNQLLQYIEDAKTWLDKAEDEFNNANSTRGELILSLAQAEVKHAWELSRGQYVSSDEKKIPVRRMTLLIPMAAGLSILLIGGGLFLSARLCQPGSVSKLTHFAGPNQPVQKAAPGVQNTIPEQKSAAPKDGFARISVFTPVKIPVALETAPEIVPVPESGVAEQSVTVKNNTPDAKEDKVIVEAEKPRPVENVRPEPPVQEVAATQERPKPALQLPVEDDLTNMASHSLKNGR